MSLLFCIQIVLAQKSITGNVTDDLGVPLPGATIIEVGTSNGTTTDFDGNYSITVEDGSSISASFVGYETFTVIVGDQDQINFSLEQGNQLDEVIVTSLGIKREKKALGYAVSEVSRESLEQRAEGDIGRVLTGKASGVQITNQSGLSGSGTSIHCFYEVWAARWLNPQDHNEKLHVVYDGESPDDYPGDNSRILIGGWDYDKRHPMTGERLDKDA